MLADPVKIERLRNLDISGNPQLKSLPIEIHDLVHLKTLQAGKCSFQRLHSLEGLTRLTLLRLDGNDLEASTVGPLPRSLAQLKLRDNHLQELPQSLWSLDKLYLLDLCGNRLEVITGVETLVSLQELLLDDNLLQELPEALASLSRLMTVSVRSNQIRRWSPSGGEGVQSIPAVIFTSSSIERLDLTHNPLRQAEIMAFDGIDIFLERRKAGKDKALSGGAMVDTSLFGLT